MNQHQSIKALDHYFDRGDYLRRERMPLDGVFTAREDVAAYDKELADFTRDYAWHDWDLSSIVPDGAKAIALLVLMSGTAGNLIFQVRPNGYTNAHTAPELRSQVSGVYVGGTLVVACDAARVIEYRASNSAAWSTIAATVIGWWK